MTDTWSTAHIGTILAIPYTAAASAGTTVTTTFGYDAAGQLISQAPSNGPATTYTYDNLGHRATATTSGVVTTYRYDDAGELVHENTHIAQYEAGVVDSSVVDDLEAETRASEAAALEALAAANFAEEKEIM